MSVGMFHFEGLGTVKIVRSRQARRMSLTVNHNREIRLTTPYWVNINEAQKFIFEKQDWIRTAVSKVSAKSPKRQIFDLDTQFNTLHHTLKLMPENRSDLFIHVENGYIQIHYPERVDVKHKQIQSAIRKGIEEAWRLEAMWLIPKRTIELAQKSGLSIGNVSIRNSRSLWGSCSAGNNINFSLHLVRLPMHLIDFVILHELAHIVHRNHGPKFHELLNTWCGGHEKELDKELTQYSSTF